MAGLHRVPTCFPQQLDERAAVVVGILAGPESELPSGLRLLLVVHLVLLLGGVALLLRVPLEWKGKEFQPESFLATKLNARMLYYY